MREWARTGDFYQGLRDDLEDRKSFRGLYGEDKKPSREKDVFGLFRQDRESQLPKDPIIARVTFYSTNIRYSDTIVRIKAIFYNNKDISITLDLPYSKKDNILKRAKVINHPRISFNDNSGQIFFVFNNWKDFDKAIILIKTIGINNNSGQFPRELFDEIKLICDSVIDDKWLKKGVTHKHIIPEKIPRRSLAVPQINPLKQNSVELIEYISDVYYNRIYVGKEFETLDKEKKQTIIDEISDFLSYGIDPNIVSPEGDTALYFVKSVDLLKPFLLYGVDVAFRSGKYLSALEGFQLSNNKNCLKLIEQEYSKPSSSLNDPSNLRVIKKPTLVRKDDEIHSTYMFAKDNIIETRRINTNKLSVDEKEAVIALAENNFECEQLKKVFNGDFDQKNTFIEIIYQKIDNSVFRFFIGYHIYTILNAEDHVVYYSVCGQNRAVKKIPNLMAFLTFNTAMSVQCLAHEKKEGEIKFRKVLIFVEMLTAISYGMLPLGRKMLHSPKYQPPLEQSTHLVKITDSIIPQIYEEDEAKMTHKGRKWYVKEKFPIRVRGYDPKKVRDIFDANFEEVFRDGNLDNIPLIKFYVSMQSLQIMADMAASLGIHIVNHMYEQADLLLPFLGEFLKVKEVIRAPIRSMFRDVAYLHWLNETKLSDVPLKLGDNLPRPRA